MHIAEGVLSAPVIVTGYVLTAGGVCYGLKKMDAGDTPRVAVLTSAFFVASLINVPFGPSSVHLVLNGLLGILSGWSVFPAILIALSLQALFFQFGGLTSLGVNTFNMAFPGLIAFFIFRVVIKSGNRYWIKAAALITPAIAICSSALLVVISLLLSGEEFRSPAKFIFLINLPVIAVESIVTFFIVNYLLKVKPELFEYLSRK